MYTGSKIKLRAYRSSDIPLINEYYNDQEVQRYYWPEISFPHTLLEDENSYKEISSAKKGHYFAIEALEDENSLVGVG